MKYTMKKVLFLIAVTAMVLSCGGNNQKKASQGAQNDKTEAPATKGKLSIGDKLSYQSFRFSKRPINEITVE